MVDNRTQLILQALEEAGANDPGLSTFYEFHRVLLRALGQAKEQISGALQWVNREGYRARQLQGLPLLSFAQLPVKGEQLAEWVVAVAQVLSDYDLELAEQTVPDSPAACLALARQRFEEGQVCSEHGEAQGKSTLAQTSVDLALKPYLEWAAEQVLSHVDQQRWKRGYCPVCGGAPDLATLDEESGARHLVCSRCDSQWDYQRLGCPFCGTTDHTKLVYYPSEDGVYRLYVCQECWHYLKTIDLREAAQAIVLPAERITTVAMDVAAQQEGYRQ
jgi:formate dehydrogenase accessory protein FdhE